VPAPNVSIIIPTHSRPHLLPRAVESARGAGRGVEVVVVDDASGDETAEVCRSLEGVRYVRLDCNQGVAGARNVGILSSTGEYISFLDDDDVRLPGSLDLQVAALDAAPEAGLVYGRALISGREGEGALRAYPERCPRGEVFWELLGRNFIPCGSAVFRRACLLRAGMLDASVPGVDDWDLWVRIAALYPVAALERPVMIWRRSAPGSGQGTSRADEIVTMATRQFRCKWLKLRRASAAPAEARRAAARRFSESMGGHLAFETLRALAGGHLGSARRNAATALGLHPLGAARAAGTSATSFCRRSFRWRR